MLGRGDNVSSVSILVVLDAPPRLVPSCMLAASQYLFQSLLSWMLLRGSTARTGPRNWNSSFNPCCLGCSSAAALWRHEQSSGSPVSILVVLDAPPRQDHHPLEPGVNRGVSI